jgi:hypothetical protein
VNEECRKVRLLLEDGGEVAKATLCHLEACGACRSHAALLTELGTVPSAVTDEQACAAIMSALPAAPWRPRRRVTVALPALAGLGLVGVGAALLGGPPAPQAVATLPGAVGGAAGWVSSWALDALSLARGGSDAARALVATGGAWLLAWLVAAALGGGWAVSALARKGHTGQR